MNVAILGGGIAGLSTAIALKQFGFKVTVYEKHNTETNIGAGIVVWPNASYVLDKLGVLTQIRSVSGYPSKMKRLSHLGENLGSIDIEAINIKMGYPSFSILRTDLQNVLLAKLHELGIQINYQHEVAKLRVMDEKTEIRFLNGITTTADIIIGADGRMSSPTRKFVLGENKPIYQGFINWIGVFQSENAIFHDISVYDYWGIGERFGIVPISQKRAYWAGGAASQEMHRLDPSEYKKELFSIFSSWPSIVREVIVNTPIEKINKIYVHDHDPIEVWHRNNVIVIGDAAHAPLPTSGQGACQALEDAWHLAKSLKSCSTDIEAAFVQFTQLRSKKTAQIIASGRGLASSVFNPDPEFCKVRNQKSKSTDYSKVASGMAQIWSQNLINV